MLQVGAYLQVVVRRSTILSVDRGLFGKAATFTGLQVFEDPQFQSRLRAAERAAGNVPHEIAHLMDTLVRTVVTMATLVGVVLVVSRALALVLVASAAVGFVAQMLRSRADVGSIDRMVHSDRWRDAYRALLLDVKAAKEIRLFGLARLFLDRLTAATECSTAEELAAERRSAILQASLAALSAGAAVFGVVLAIAGVARGELVPGDVVLLLAAIAGISNVFAGLLITLGTIGRTLTMFHRYLEVMAIPSEPGGAIGPLAPLGRGIELRDVWFRYDAGSPWVLRGVDLTIPSGRAVALVGLNGAGKTTLVKLLCRFYDVERGQILWDGVDIRTIDPRALRRRIGATFQDFMTYDLTAQENIGLGDVERLDDLDRVREAAQARAAPLAGGPGPRWQHGADLARRPAAARPPRARLPPRRYRRVPCAPGRRGDRAARRAAVPHQARRRARGRSGPELAGEFPGAAGHRVVPARQLVVSGDNPVSEGSRHVG